MALSTEDSIATTSMLIERESAYARIAEIEVEIDRLFQGAYPFPCPESVPPSQTGPKAKKARKAKKAKASKPAKRRGIKLRRLKEGEYAYRYLWREKDAEQVAIAMDAGLVENFIKSPPSGIRIMKVETVDIDSLAQETLYEADPPT
jgi:hypothetical protein